MGTTQKYSLKWNDFTVNVASTFRELHSRHDFVDVTLACSDGSTLEAHKVILSSVSTYFRDILKSAPSKHPIIILKDTGRDEASAMLEFAYTGEVNVAQELLPSLLHTARAFRIKGLDKVESPVDPPPPPPDTAAAAAAAVAAAAAAAAVRQNSAEHHHWSQSSAPNTRSHSPSSIHSQQDVKPPSFPPTAEHFLASAAAAAAVDSKPPQPPQAVVNPSAPPAAHSSPAVGPSTSAGVHHLPAAAVAAAAAAAFPTQTGGIKRGRERELSPPRSRPPTREASPCPQNNSNSRTPPPKRWKRSFDMTQPMNGQKEAEQQQPNLPMIAENYSSRPESAAATEYEPSKRFPAASPSPAAAAAVTSGRTLPYPHSMPTSPTMFERGNEIRLAGLIRHHLANPDGGRGAAVAAAAAAQQQSLVQPQQRPESSTAQQPGAAHQAGVAPGGATGQVNGGSSDYDPVDYRLPSNDRSSRDSDDPRFPRSNSLGAAPYRPDSAPTVLDMSPEGSLSGPPTSVHGAGPHGEEHDGAIHGEDLTDCVGKAFTCTPDAMGRYSCDECGKIFKHPGSLQHHRHIHRGTHRCPSCGKAFSRRWDMERHLNKSKYGCPANRFSAGSAGSSAASSASSGAATGAPVLPPPAALAAAANGAPVAALIGAAASAPTTPTAASVVVSAAPAVAAAAAAHMELLANATNGVHNTTA